jgi:ATP-binding cassette subfamily F protein 3
MYIYVYICIIYTHTHTHTHTQERVSRVERAQKLYDEQQAEIEHLEDYIRRFGAKFSHAAQAQDKRKKLERINLNRVEAPTDLETVEVC